MSASYISRTHVLLEQPSPGRIAVRKTRLWCQDTWNNVIVLWRSLRQGFNTGYLRGFAVCLAYLSGCCTTVYIFNRINMRCHLDLDDICIRIGSLLFS